LAKVALIADLTMLMYGCATQTLESHSYKGYTVGKKATTTVGDPLLVDQDGTTKKIKRWVGIMNSPDGWAIETRNSEDFVRKELIYSGKSGSTIELSYREYRGGLAAPAFFQNIKYDLSESSIISFQKYRIEVLSATNQNITCTILGP
jgi:hypothetical protein